MEKLSVATIQDKLMEVVVTFCNGNKNRFYQITGLGNGFLDKDRDKIHMETVIKITKAFPNLNPSYFAPGERDIYKKGYSAIHELDKDEQIRLLTDMISTRDDIIMLLKRGKN